MSVKKCACGFIPLPNQDLCLECLDAHATDPKARTDMQKRLEQLHYTIKDLRKAVNNGRTVAGMFRNRIFELEQEIARLKK